MLVCHRLVVSYGMRRWSPRHRGTRTIRAGTSPGEEERMGNGTADGRGGLQITWLGHSTVSLVTPGGKRILIDPWLTGNPSCPPDRKEIAALDLMLVTHGH